MSDSGILGRWWRQDDPGNQIPGVLYFLDDGSVEIDLLADVSEPILGSQDLLLGEADGDFYSLTDLQPKRQGFRFSSSTGRKDTWYVRNVVERSHLGSGVERFERLSFNIEGIQEWSAHSGLRNQLVWTGDNPHHSHAAQRNTPTPLSLATDAFEFKLHSQMAAPRKRWGLSWQEDTQVHVRGKTPLSLEEWWQQVIRPIQRLVQTSLRTGGTVRRAAVSHQREWDSEDGPLHTWLPWRAAWMRKYAFDDSRFRFESPLFTASDFIETPNGLQAWFELYESAMEPIDAVLQMDSASVTSEYRFFVHARLMERLVERFPKSELFSESDLERIMDAVLCIVDESIKEEMGHRVRGLRRGNVRNQILDLLNERRDLVSPLNRGDISLDWLTGKILNTRNCFAHHSKDTCKNAIDSGDLKYFEALVAILIELEIILRLGFSVDRAYDRIKETRRQHRANVVTEVWQSTQVV